jgi:hypothetical protein
MAVTAAGMARRPPAWDTDDMTDLRCPYLVRETEAYRDSLALSQASPTTVVVTWYCSHPFHGIRIELGDGRADAEQHCEICTLPRPGDEPQAQGPRPTARWSVRRR